MTEPPSAGRKAGADPSHWRWLRTDVVLLAGGIGLLIWITGPVLLLIFAGILLAVGFDGIARFLARHTPLSRGWALAIVLLATPALLIALGGLVIPQFIGQVDELVRQLQGFVGRLQEALGRFGWTEMFRGGDDQGVIADAATGVVSQVASTTLTLIGMVGSLLIMFTITLFASINPALYRAGLIKLVFPRGRKRMDRMLSASAHALRWWFLGQIISMAFLGVTVSLGLMFIGVELWLSLGLLAGLLTFVPYIGPILAGISVVIIAFAQGTSTGVIALAFYLVIQNLEGNFVTPMIQQRAVSLPPVLLISVQVLLSVLFGAPGLMLAAPLTVLGMVAVKVFYIEGMLGESADLKGV